MSELLAAKFSQVSDKDKMKLGSLREKSSNLTKFRKRYKVIRII